MSSFDVIENGWLAAPEVEAEAVSQCCVLRRADLQRRQLLGDGGRRYLLRMYGKYDGSGVFDGCML